MRGRVVAALFVLTLVAGPGCATPDPTIRPADDATVAAIASHRKLDPAHRLELAGSDEPGRRLLLAGRLVRRGDGQPIEGRSITFFHTSAEGSYEETVAGDESTARLSGTLVSGPGGAFFVSSILPGGYGSSDDGGHIHTAVENARPEFYDFFFTQFAGAGLRRWAERSGQGILLELRSAGDTLVATGDLPVGPGPETDD